MVAHGPEAADGVLWNPASSAFFSFTAANVLHICHNPKGTAYSRIMKTTPITGILAAPVCGTAFAGKVDQPARVSMTAAAPAMGESRPLFGRGASISGIPDDTQRLPRI